MVQGQRHFLKEKAKHHLIQKVNLLLPSSVVPLHLFLTNKKITCVLMRGAH